MSAEHIGTMRVPEVVTWAERMGCEVRQGGKHIVINIPGHRQHLTMGRGASKTAPLIVIRKLREYEHTLPKPKEAQATAEMVHTVTLRPAEPRPDLLKPQIGAGAHSQSAMIETISPEAASAWIQRDATIREQRETGTTKPNRKLSEAHTLYLARLMQSGEWQDANGETIILSTEGLILDGQHRLTACLASGVTIRSYVVRNMSEKVFITLNTGKSRSTVNILAMSGHQYTAVAAAACRMAILWDRWMEAGGPSGSSRSFIAQKEKRFHPTETLHYLEQHPDLVASIHFCASNYTSSKDCWPKSAMSFCHFMFKRIDAKKADEMVEVLRSGAGLGKEHPLLRLREFFINARLRQRHVFVDEQVGMIIKAWNAWQANESVRYLTWRADEKMPLPE